MRHALVRIAVVLLVLFPVAWGFSPAQVNQRDTNSIRSFLDSSARTIYFLAWPTATYRTYSLDNISLAQDGFDVTVTLDGTSGLDGSDLWAKLVVPIRSDGIKQPWVLRHNAIVMDPFVTTKTMAQTLVQLSQQYANANGTAAPSSPPQPAPVRPVLPPAEAAPAVGFIGSDAVCIVNATGMDLHYTFRWGTAEWAKDTLGQGMQEVYFWKNTAAQPGSPQFTLSYDDDPYTDGTQERTYTLDRAAASVAPDCPAAKQYVFRMDSGKILMFAR